MIQNQKMKFSAWHLRCLLLYSIFASQLCFSYDDVTVAKNGDVYACSFNKKEVYRYNADGRLIISDKLPASPTQILQNPEKNQLLVAAGQGVGWLYVLDSQSLKVLRTLPCGHSPQGMRFSPDRTKLALAQRFQDQVWILDAETLERKSAISVPREPVDLDWYADSKLVAVHHLSNRSAIAKWTGGSMSTIDLKSGEQKNIPLEDGSSGARHIVLTPDKRYALSVMPIGSHRVPATQIAQGWINKNGLSVVDLKTGEYLGSILLDELSSGAANPWDIIIAKSYAWISIAGTHEVFRFDYKAMISYLASSTPKQRENLPYDLRLSRQWKKRFPARGKGPRAICLNSDKTALYVACYFSKSIERYSLPDGNVKDIIAPQPIKTAQRGEFLFHHGTMSFQGWMSCSSCHPDARTDAINWDLENDGLGSPRQVKNMLYAHALPPTTITGCRPNAETSVRAGLKFLRAVVPEADAIALDTYLKSLRPVASPFLSRSGEFSASAKAGKVLFETKGACINCHSGFYNANKTSANVGTGLGKEKTMKYDVPTLNESWRTAPYLHDGRAVNYKEIFTKFNDQKRHGQAHTLTPEELDQLIEYLKTL